MRWEIVTDEFRLAEPGDIVKLNREIQGIPAGVPVRVLCIETTRERGTTYLVEYLTPSPQPGLMILVERRVPIGICDFVSSRLPEGI